MRLFAYGTLVFEEVWHAVVGRPRQAEAGLLRGSIAAEVSGVVFPILAPGTPRDCVAGLVIDGLDQQTWTLLDEYEGNLFCRRTVEVETKCHRASITGQC